MRPFLVFLSPNNRFFIAFFKKTEFLYVSVVICISPVEQGLSLTRRGGH